MKNAKPPVVAVLLSLSVAGVANADYATIIGGPTYDSTTGTGYQGSRSAWQELIAGSPAYIAGDGSGLTTLTKYVNKTAGNAVPVQWTASGMTEFSMPSIAGSGTAAGSVYNQNASGIAAGSQIRYSSSGNTPTTYQAIRWDTPAQPTVLANGISGPLVGSYGGGINAAGTSVGSSFQLQLDSSGFFYNSTYSRPVRWAAGGSAATPLDVIGTSSRTTATNSGDAVGIDANGTTYGTVYAYEVLSPNYIGNFGLTAVRWNAGGTAVTELAHAPAPANGFTEDWVSKVRPNGVLAGTTETTVNGRATRSPTRWSADGSVTVLDLPSNAVASSTFTRAFGLNDGGTVVGVYTTQSSGYDGIRPARWDAGTSTATALGLLGTPTSTTSAWPLSVNNAGVAVGVQRAHTIDDQDSTAVIWGLDGVAVDLNSFIDPASNWKLVEADSISDTGWVAGVGLYDPDGTGPLAAYDRPFLIQVPEPTTIGIAALFGFAAMRRVRKYM